MKVGSTPNHTDKEWLSKPGMLGLGQSRLLAVWLWVPSFCGVVMGQGQTLVLGGLGTDSKMITKSDGRTV